MVAKKETRDFFITGILTILETHFKNQYIGAILAVVLSMGGNDYLPNFHGISHEKLVDSVLSQQNILNSLLNINKMPENSAKKYECKLDIDTYIALYANLYYPKKIPPNKLTIGEIHQMSVKVPGKK